MPPKAPPPSVVLLRHREETSRKKMDDLLRVQDETQATAKEQLSLYHRTLERLDYDKENADKAIEEWQQDNRRLQAALEDGAIAERQKATEEMLNEGREKRRIRRLIPKPEAGVPMALLEMGYDDSPSHQSGSSSECESDESTQWGG